MSQPFSIPILFLIFNRPGLTRQSLACLRALRPASLYVAADGPRSTVPDDARRCSETRSIVETGINWPCSIHTRFNPDNRGCRQAVSEAITWFFEHEPEGIILEDDCIPTPSFFPFCETMLNHYRNDSRIFHISGVNLMPTPLTTQDSYYFSKFPHVWGWASWRRAWLNYDVTMASWPRFKETHHMAEICPTRHEQEIYTGIFDKVHSKQIDTWDYQWIFTCWSQHALSIIPRHSLVSNNGFGPDATHTKKFNPRFANRPVTPLDVATIHHPPSITRNATLDNELVTSIYPPPSSAHPPPSRFKQALNHLFHQGKTVPKASP